MSEFVFGRNSFNEALNNNRIIKAYITGNDQIIKLLEKKWPDKQEMTFEQNQKLIAYLARKGYSFDHIRTALRRYIEDD